MESKTLIKVEEAAERLSLGRSKTWELVTAGELRTVRIGRAVRIPVDEIAAYTARLLAAQSGGRAT